MPDDTTRRTPGWRPYVETGEYQASIAALREMRKRATPDPGPIFGWVHWTAIETASGEPMAAREMRSSATKCCNHGHRTRDAAGQCAALRFALDRKRTTQQLGSAVSSRITIAEQSERERQEKAAHRWRRDLDS